MNKLVATKYTGHFDTAYQLYRRALRIAIDTLGPNHTDVASIYHNLGGLEHARGRFRRGEPFPAGPLPSASQLLALITRLWRLISRHLPVY